MVHLRRLPLLIRCAMMVLTIADLITKNTEGKKQVDYYIEVVAIPASNNMKLLVFPWSESNGTPSGDVKFVNAGDHVKFGRKINGKPKFWAVLESKVADIENVKADVSHNNFQMVDLLNSWFNEAGNAVACTGAAINIDENSFLADKDSLDSKRTDQFSVTSLSADSCVVEFKGLKPTSVAADSEAKPKSAVLVVIISIVALGLVCALVWWLWTQLQYGGSFKQARDGGSLNSPLSIEMKSGK